MATTAIDPVKLSFGIEDSVSCFCVVEVDREETLDQPVDSLAQMTGETYQLQIRKSKQYCTSKQAPKNAFQLLFNAQNRKTLPAKLKDLFKQKLALFN